MQELRAHIRDIPDFPKPGVIFRDITPLLAHHEAFATAVRQLAAEAPQKITHVAAIDARGFLFASAVALELGLGLVPVRKPGKLPAETLSIEYDLEYGKDKLMIHKDALKKGDRVYLIDDLIATGGTLAAAAQLITSTGATMSKIACVIELAGLGGKESLPKGVGFASLVKIE